MDVLVISLIALALGLLFPWWVGAGVFMLGVTVSLTRRHTKHTGLCMTPEEKRSYQQSLREWNEWEDTHGPSAPGISNPSRRED